MLHASEFIATFCAALFAGAALYISVVEHPSRMGLETRICRRAVGTELQTRHVVASTSGSGEPKLACCWSAGVGFTWSAPP
jgi:hypothetical protein